MKHVLKTALFAIVAGHFAQLAQSWLQTDFLNAYLTANLLTILIALLAINSTTTGLILTKIRELIEKTGSSEPFQPVKKEMLLAVKEQIGLIITTVILLTVTSSELLAEQIFLLELADTLLVGVFLYALYILYDTASGVLLIIDFEST